MEQPFTFSLAKAGLFLALGLLPTPARAADLVVQLGDQDFSESQGVNGVAEFDAASVGEPGPFNQFRGTDLSLGSPFSESWTFTYAAGIYSSATFTLGITDHDSQAPGSQIAFFGFDGIDLTSLLNAQFEAFGGRQFENNIYTITIPGAVLASLADGSATFTFTLQGPSLGGNPLTPTPESLPGNGAGVDFSRLALTPVPEPEALGLLALSAAAWIAVRARKGRS